MQPTTDNTMTTPSPAPMTKGAGMSGVAPGATAGMTGSSGTASPMRTFLRTESGSAGVLVASVAVALTLNAVITDARTRAAAFAPDTRPARRELVSRLLARGSQAGGPKTRGGSVRPEL